MLTEEEAADFIKQGGFTKPFLCYVAGKYVLEDVRYGHSGALISKGLGDVNHKLKRLKESGAIVLEHLDDVAREVKRVLNHRELARVSAE